MAVDVVGAERLFHPVGVVRLVAAQVSERGGHVAPGVVGVEHEKDIGTDRFARRRNAFFFLGRRQAADFHLDRVETGFDVARELFAEHLVRFAREVVTAARVSGHPVFHERPEIFGIAEFAPCVH